MCSGFFGGKLNAECGIELCGLRCQLICTSYVAYQLADVTAQVVRIRGS